MYKQIGKFTAGGYRLIAFIKVNYGSHVVGLIPSGKNEWRMASNWVPIEERLTSGEVFEYLDQSKGKFNGKPLPNILALNPEKKNGK